MKWRKEDLEKYVQAKEYIDTLLVPLIPYQIGEDEESEKNAFQKEVISIFADRIEQELSGRVMLAPSYFYLKHAKKDIEVERVNQWSSDARNQPFQHIIFLTFDPSWKKHEKTLDGELLWLPGMQSGDLNSKETHQLMSDQITQISEIIRSFW